MTAEASNVRESKAAEEPAVRFHPAVFVGFLILCLIVGYPGRLNEDSFAQLMGAANQTYLNDLHSPFVTWMWSIPAAATGQPAGALVVNSLLLSLYAAVVPIRLPREFKAVLALVLETLFKLFLAAWASLISKDVVLVALLLAALAAGQLAGKGARRRPWLWAGAACLALSLMIRPSNFVMLAVAVALFLPAVVRSVRSYFVIAAVAAFLLALSVPFYLAANRWLFGARSGHVETQLLLFDAAGISVATGTNQFARLPGWPTDRLPPPADCYTPMQAATMTPWGRCTNYWLAQEQVVARHGRHTIGLWWLRTIVANPLAYARHRAAFSAKLLDARTLYLPPGTRTPPVWKMTGRDIPALNSDGRAGHFARAAAGRPEAAAIQWWRPNRLQLLYLGAAFTLHSHRRTDIVALAACLLVVGAAWRRRRQAKPVLLSATLAGAIGVGNAAMHFALGVAAQQRYLLPTFCCALVALIAYLRAPRPVATLDGSSRDCVPEQPPDR